MSVKCFPTDRPPHFWEMKPKELKSFLSTPPPEGNLLCYGSAGKVSVPSPAGGLHPPQSSRQPGLGTGGHPGVSSPQTQPGPASPGPQSHSGTPQRCLSTHSAMVSHMTKISGNTITTKERLDHRYIYIYKARCLVRVAGQRSRTVMVI